MQADCLTARLTLAGQAGSSSAWSLVMQRSAPGMGSTWDLPPTAIRMFLAVYRLPSTCAQGGSSRRAAAERGGAGPTSDSRQVCPHMQSGERTHAHTNTHTCTYMHTASAHIPVHVVWVAV